VDFSASLKILVAESRPMSGKKKRRKAFDSRAMPLRFSNFFSETSKPSEYGIFYRNYGSSGNSVKLALPTIEKH
jgi:hypothetical protein